MLIANDRIFMAIELGLFHLTALLVSTIAIGSSLIKNSSTLKAEYKVLIKKIKK